MAEARGSTTDLFCEFRDTFALDTADRQVFRSGSKFTLRSRNGRCAIRRPVARFQAMGHTAGPMEVMKEERNPRFPVTLDLRRGPRASD